MRVSLLRRAFALLAALALLCSLSAPSLADEPAREKPWLGITYVITRADSAPVVVDGSGEPDLTGYPLVLRDSGRFRDLAAAARYSLTVRHGGELYSLDSDSVKPFSRIFADLGFTPSPLEAVRVEVSRGRMDVTVSSDISYYVREAEVTPYQTVRRANPAMKQGEETVVQVGAAGEKGGVYEVYWSHGAIAGRQLVEVLDSEPVDEIVEYGAARAPAAASGSLSVSRDGDGGGALALPDGSVLRFTRSVSMTATAYTAGHGGAGAVTASGTRARTGVVAVDPKVIPLGTKLYIVANGGVVYGKAVAEDTGVRGNSVDLYMDTYRQCVNFGRRGCMVYVLE